MLSDENDSFNMYNNKEKNKINTAKNSVYSTKANSK